jgi:ribosomal protein L7Ae-like RNA K-turn-binding protein
MTAQIAGRIKGFLGLCTRAGQLILGQEACVDAVRRHSVSVILLDEGCSDNTRKRFLDACQTHGTPLYSLEPELIALAVGKEGRKVAAVKTGGMAEKMLSLLAEEPKLGRGNADP